MAKAQASASDRAIWLEPAAARTAPLAATGTISGTLFDDRDGDGVQDAGERGQRDWRVFLDANGNGRFDLGERSTTSDAAGHYAFADVAPGDYRLVVQARFGWQHWAFGDAAAVLEVEALLSPVERMKAAVAVSQAAIAASGHRYLDADFGLPHVAGQLVVRLAEGGATPAAAQALMASVGAELVASTVALGVQLWQVHGLSIEDAAARLTASGQVLYATPNYIAEGAGVREVEPDDPRYVQQYGPDQVNAPAAWAYGTGSHQVIVGDIDSGMDLTHPDLRANLWTNAGEIAGNGIDDDGNGYVDDVHGWDFVNEDADPSDDYSHGTHTAGTIGATGDNGIGVTGVNWSVAIMPLKFIDANNHGTSFDAARAVEYATMMGATITNNSYGVGPANELYDAIAAGGLFVAAAGNNGSNNDQRGFFPASFDLDNIVSVAAVDYDRNLADFSNYGRRSVDLAAPGVHVMSTYPVADGGYGYGSGTSMATPHVAGAAALLMALAPGLSIAEVKAALLDGADPLESLRGKVLTGGELDLLGALYAVSQTSVAVTVEGGATAVIDVAAHGAATGGDDVLHGYDLAERIAGGRGDDGIDGGAGDDVLSGGAGDDRLSGGAGADRFVFGDRGGHDAILDFGAGDRIVIRSAQAQGYDDLAITSDGHGGTIVAFGAVEIDVVGVRPGALGPEDFAFAAAAGFGETLVPNLALA